MSVLTRKAQVSRQARFASCLPAVLHELGDYECYAANISRTGVQLVGDLPVPAGRKVRVTVRSAAGDLAFKCTARIVRVVGGDEPGEVIVGVEFLALDPGSSAVLEKLVARVKENRAPSPLANVDAQSASPGSRDSVQKVSKSQRIAMAQRAQLEERAKLFLDNDPHVLEGLARNPRLSKRELRALAQRRELLPTTIAILAAHPRARGDEGFLALVAAHPATPIQIAQGIAKGMSPAGLRRLLRAPTLSDGLRTWLLDKYPDAQGGSW